MASEAKRAHFLRSTENPPSIMSPRKRRTVSSLRRRRIDTVIDRSSSVPGRLPIRRDYEQSLSPKAQKALADLSKFIAKNSYVATLRNGYVFHYPSKKLNDAMSGIPDHDDWNFYLGETDGNSLYYLSEMIAVHAMLAEVNSDKAAGFEKMIDDRDYVARRIIALSTGCMNVFVKRHLGLRMEDGTPNTIKVPNLLDVKLPFFMELEQE